LAVTSATSQSLLFSEAELRDRVERLAAIYAPSA
jgi:hypothetical protein